MIIQKITKKDLLDIWIWRNDKKSIYFSKNKKKITLEAHTKWFDKNLKNKKMKFYIGYLCKENVKKKIGVVRFDLKSKYALVSINLNPTFRGRSLSFASIKCFLKNRFYFFKSRNQYNFYQRSLG